VGPGQEVSFERTNEGARGEMYSGAMGRLASRPDADLANKGVGIGENGS